MTVNLIEPGTLYGDRVNEIDFRFAKILRFGRTRTNVGFDIYNILNSAPVLTYNQTFTPDRHHVADAELGAAAAVLEVQRAGGLLETKGSGLQATGSRPGGGTEAGLGNQARLSCLAKEPGAPEAE